MEYKYLHQYNLSNKLAKTLSSIISNKENEDYICKVINFKIPKEKNCSFFVIMKVSNLETLSKLSFDNILQLKNILHSYSIVCENYLGAFDSRHLIQKFPYLQNFFSELEKWRIQTGRVTLDKCILDESEIKILTKIK